MTPSSEEDQVPFDLNGLKARAKNGVYAHLLAEHCTYHRTLHRRVHSPMHPGGRASWKQRDGILEGASLRVCRPDGTTWFNATSGPATDAVARLLGRPRPEPLPLGGTPHPSLMSGAGRRAWLEAASDAVFSLSDAVISCAVAYVEQQRERFIAGSEGTCTCTRDVWYGYRVDVRVKLNGEVFEAYATAGGTSETAVEPYVDPEVLAREAVQRAVRLSTAGTPPPGRTVVILENGWGGAWLHEAIGHRLEADVTSYSDVKPDTRLSELPLTIVDDAQVTDGRVCYSIDDEGTPAGQTTLVSEGYLTSFMTDRRTSIARGLPLTGNGRCQDYRFPPLPRMTNLLLLPGSHAPEDLVASVREGIYVKLPSGGHTSAANDRYSVGVLEAYRIEGGRLTSGLTGFSLAGNAREALRSIRGIGNDFRLETTRGLCLKNGQVVSIGVGMPTLLLDAVEIIPARD